MRFNSPLGGVQVVTVGGTERIVVAKSLTFTNTTPQSVSIPLAATDASLTLYVVGATAGYGFNFTAVGDVTGNGYQTGQEQLVGPNSRLGTVTLMNVYGAADPTVTLTLTPVAAVTAFPVTLTLVVLALPDDQFTGNYVRPLVVSQVVPQTTTVEAAATGNYGPTTLLPANPDVPIVRIYAVVSMTNISTTPPARCVLTIAGADVWVGMAGVPSTALGPIQLDITHDDLKLQVFAGGAESWRLLVVYTSAPSIFY